MGDAEFRGARATGGVGILAMGLPWQILLFAVILPVVLAAWAITRAGEWVVKKSKGCDHDFIGLYGHPAAFKCKKCGKLTE